MKRKINLTMRLMVAAFLLCAALSANAQESVKEQNASPYEEQTKSHSFRANC
jgi:hypothetical protein